MPPCYRCWKAFEQLWRDKQHALQQPDVLILAGGTSVMYLTEGGWLEDTAWRDSLQQVCSQEEERRVQFTCLGSAGRACIRYGTEY